MRDNRAGANNGAAADRHARKNRGIRTNIRPSANTDRLDLEIGLHDWQVDRDAGMSRAQHFCPGAPANVVLEGQIAGVEVRLRANPNVIADDCRPVVASLNVGLRADEDTVADLERLQVLEAYATADL